MNISVLGVGKVGENLVKTFAKDGHNVVAIDRSDIAVAKLVNRYDVKGVVGNGIEKEAMLNADVIICDVFIACTSRDEVNVLSCILAKRLGAKRTIARVRDPELFKEIENMKEEFGLDMAFNPELRTAHAIAEILEFPSANSVESFAGGKASMVSFTIEEANPIVNKSLIDIAGYGYKLLFAIVVRGEKTFVPKGDFVIREGDEVYIIAKEKELANFCKQIKIFKHRSKSVFIVGGGRIAYYLAKELSEKGVSVKIVEKDLEICKELSAHLPSVSVICGDGTDQTVLDEENFKNASALVTLTGMDETNVIVSMYANQKRVDKIVTKVNNDGVSDMVKALGLDTVISAKEVIANHIIRFVRAIEVDEEKGINNLYRLHEKIEAIEFNIDGECQLIGNTLRQLKIKKDVLIGGIVRAGEYILPSGDCELKEGDRVIVVASANSVGELADILR